MAYKLFLNFPNHFHLFTRELIRQVAVLPTPVFYLALSKANFMFEKSGIFLLVYRR